MIDRHLSAPIGLVLGPPARRLAAAGVSADAITVAGFLIGIGGAGLLAGGAYLGGLVAILLSRVCDGLDGAVARIAGATDRGAFLDIALDFVFYASIPLGFALADPGRNGLPAAVLLASFMGTASSFLAFSAIAARREMLSAAFPRKGVYYLGGLTEGFETIAVFAAMCLWPAGFPVLAYGFAAACAVTTWMRWWWGWRSFR